MDEIIRKIGLYGIVPVVKIERPEDTIPLAKSFCRAGLPVMEVTYRTNNAESAIREIAAEMPQMLVGAGTVIEPSQVESAVRAGAKFVVTPNLDVEVVKACQRLNIPVLPGCATPTDIAAAMSLGLKVVKFFPAEASGGLSMIKAMNGPFGMMKFLPTGGINLDNMMDYLKNDKILAVGGTFMANEGFVRDGQFDRVEMMTRLAMSRMYGFSLMHIGINCENETDAQKWAGIMGSMFGFDCDESAGGIFTGGCLEFMKKPYLGEKGHIAIGTNFLDRAMFRFETMGFKFDRSQDKFNDRGDLKAAYFADEFFGFAIHLIQK
ncbi:MAG: bifunctional 4-hydroxy-2-oxoglutarate aldolase/2-dehydro-3-deoxy-phosphogluconate aldolase [Clostridiales bacterium]|jgi:2-dehydro-3-deoxyphosphogluconate aldolase/(4S)-4-hydroxy-2-oxoglutarate aldolase|nr:bifunctional 4-hydroxy-2-oxoglutarate aldolase/2-dehydro-3-deoxy-phosphogluconate aldolase [Clostridiales bacterium]